MARRPARASAAASCKSSVDLPMPGSPPMSSAEPGTMPPPVTRSSSVRPVEKRGASPERPLRPSKAMTRPLPPLRASPEPGGATTSASSIERVPFPARGALAGPARRNGAAVLAHEGRLAEFRHARSVRLVEIDAVEARSEPRQHLIADGLRAHAHALDAAARARRDRPSRRAWAAALRGPSRRR